MTPPTEDILINFGTTIRRLRTSLRLSQEGLAELSGLDRTYISDLERGNRNVALKNIHALATALGVTPADLFPLTTPAYADDDYLCRLDFAIDCGFHVTGSSVVSAAQKTNSVMNALPSSLFRTVDFKAQSGMIGAVFAAELATLVGAIPNPIEKGYPDIVPASAATASEPELRNYPTGLEIKCTVGSVTKGSARAPGSARIGLLTSLTWQAHHQEVSRLMGLTWDYVGGSSSQPKPPVRFSHQAPRM